MCGSSSILYQGHHSPYFKLMQGMGNITAKINGENWGKCLFKKKHVLKQAGTYKSCEELSVEEVSIG